MTAPGHRTTRSAGRRWRRGVAVVGLIGGLAVAASACGAGSATPTAATDASSTAIVEPPDAPLQGCSYETDGQAPPAWEQGIQPPFPAFTPDHAAEAALGDIRQHGGTGLVNGFNIPAGSKLYAGPDSGSAAVATVESGHSLLFQDPVYWKTSSGGQWLASFVACGGQNLYWVDIAQVRSADPAAGRALSTEIKDMEGNGSFTQTGEVSTLPVRIGQDRTFEWSTTKALQFDVGRGVYLDY